MPTQRYNANAWFAATLLVWPIAMFFSAPSKAVETNFGLGYALEYTDNVRLAPSNPEEEWINVASAGLTVQQNSPTLDANLNARASYRSYQNNVFPDETQLGLGSGLLWRILPNRFTWMAEDYVSQTEVQSFEANTPANRQDTNVFNTGPDFTLRINSVQSVQLNGRYARNTYSVSDVDSTRDSAGVKWIYQASSQTTFSLNHDVQTVNYDNNLRNSNFKRQDSVFQTLYRLPTNQFALDAGKTTIERDNGAKDDGSLGRFSWTHQLNAVSAFVLVASSELSDSSRENLTTAQALASSTPSLSAPSASNTGSIFQAKKMSATYSRRRAQGNDVIGVFSQKDERQSTLTEETRKGGTIDLGYEFSAALAASVFARQTKTESNVVVPAVFYRETSIGTRFINRFRRNFYLNLDLTRNQRSSANLLQSYTEKRAVLSLSYSDNTPKR